mmetsp:Transcript_3060/g.6330  ORF Transcript_3060/g.6330 Transcript_3060/m.6330 type:complete len:224 (-) Transcript_3060:1574-2245(-)
MNFIGLTVVCLCDEANLAMLWLLAFVYLTQGQECPVAKCKELDPDVCVIVADMFLVINENGCYKDEYCNVTNAYEQWDARNHTVLYCEDLEDHDYSSDDFICEERDSTERLETGVHPKRCNSDDDCLMKNGLTTACECGLDGFKYCKPGLGSQVFDYLWADCEERDGEVTEEQWRYWLDFQADYHYYVMAPACARAVFYELEWLMSVPDLALGLAVGSVMVLS